MPMHHNVRRKLGKVEMRAPGLPREVPGMFVAWVEGRMTAVEHEELIGLFDHGLDAQVWEACTIEATIQLLDSTFLFADNPTKPKHLPVEHQ